MQSETRTETTYYVEHRKAFQRDYSRLLTGIKWHEEQLARDELAQCLEDDPAGDYRLVTRTKTITNTVF